MEIKVYTISNIIQKNVISCKYKIYSFNREQQCTTAAEGYSLIFGYGLVLLRSPIGGASVALCSSTPRVLSGVYALLGPPL